MDEGFPAPTLDAWRAQVEKDLKGRSPDDIVWRTEDGFDVPPLLSPAHLDGLPHLDAPVVPDGTGAACALPLLQLTGIAAAAEAVRAEIDAGGRAVNVLLSDDAVWGGLEGADDGPEGIGVGIETLDDLDAVLAAVDLERCYVRLEGGASALSAGALLLALADRRGVPRESLRGSLDFCPLAGEPGETPLEPFLAAGGAQVLVALRNACPGVRPLCIEGQPFHGAGATAAQELALTFAEVARCVRGLGREELGLSPADVAASINVGLSVTPDVLASIAKLRAARLLWRQMLSSCGIAEDAVRMELHARASSRVLAEYDRHTNLLRTTLCAFAATVGGADFVEVGPYTGDPLNAPPGDFETRVARNQMRLLLEEAHLGRVTDAAAGSYAVEHLTDRLARTAARLALEMDAGRLGDADGDLRRSRSVCDMLEAAEAARTAGLAARRRTLVGVTRFADPSGDEPVPGGVDLGDPTLLDQEPDTHEIEVPPDAAGPFETALARAVAAAARGVGLAELRAFLPPGRLADRRPGEFGYLVPHRDAEPFEMLRLSMQEHRYRTGAWPRALLLTFGAHGVVRAAYAADVLRVGGIDVVDPPPFDDREQAVAAAVAERPAMVVLCSDAKSLPEDIEQLVPRLRKELPETLVYVAGRPPEGCAPIDGALAVGIDLIQVLGYLHNRLGVEL